MNALFDPMSITLDDEQTQRIFLTLVESLEDGERLPTKILVTYLQHPEDSIRKLAVELIEYGNDPAAIRALLRAAADSNIEVSLSASEVLRSFRNPAAVQYLIEGLSHRARGDPSRGRRRIAGTSRAGRDGWPAAQPWRC
jgi:HEAT repeat protein